LCDSLKNKDSFDFACVSPDYKSTSFCELNDVCKSKNCGELTTRINQCFDVVSCDGGNFTIEIKTDASAWKQQSDGCFEHFCDNGRGNVVWSLCNSSDKDERVCADDKCMNFDSLRLLGWTVVITVKDMGVEDYNKTEVVESIAAASGVRVARVASEVKNRNVVKIIPVAKDKKTAIKIKNAVESCCSNRETREIVECQGFLKRNAESADVVSKSLFLSDAPRIFGNTMLITNVVSMLMLLLLTVIF